MPPVPGPRPDQIKQPSGTTPGDVLTAGASNPSFQAPASTTFGLLSTGVYNFVGGTISADIEYPTLDGDFQAWDALTSTAPSGEVHVSYEGRVTPDQVGITSISVPIKGTGDYALKVYVEGAATANPIFDSGVLAASASRTVTTILDSSLPEQPIGEKRYFVVVEAFIDDGEAIRVGRPFARQD